MEKGGYKVFYDIKKIVTDNPFVDHIIYECKKIILNCITKDVDKADSMETVESIRNYNIYKSCKRGNANWNMWTHFPDEVVYTALESKYTVRKIKSEFLGHKEWIYTEDKEDLVKAMSDYVLANYEEKNDYYRELCGYRPYSSTINIPLKDYDLSYFEGELDIYTYLHEVPEDKLLDLVKIGVIDKIHKDYPEEKWIFFMMMRLDPAREEIKLDVARNADRFDLLYIPEDVDEMIKNEFIEKYETNREYAVTCIYSEAMKIESDYYDNFIQILIMIMTMMDMLDNVQTHVARRDIFDARCIQYIFEQYGIPYYSEIPLQYQSAMLRNLNRLLKFKSSARCMVDICSLFGFPSSSVFQYYLLRRRRTDQFGNYIFNYRLRHKPINCTPTTKKINVISLSEGENSVTLNLPFADYFAKGNKVEVLVDGTILPEEEYKVGGGKVVFTDVDYLRDRDKIEIVYLYNEDQSIMDEVKDHEILMKDEILEYRKSQTQYQLHPPEPDYFNNGGFCFVIIGTVMINQELYTIDPETFVLTFTELGMEDLKDDNRYMRILYMYSNSIEVLNKTVDVEATEQRQRIFEVPEPFEGYCDAGLKFFITLGGVYVSAERYHLKGKMLYFNDETDFVDKGRLLSFHFIYNEFSDVELVEESVKLDITSKGQKIFELPVPFPSYFDDGNFVFIKLRNEYIDPNFYYILNNTLYIKSGHSIFPGTDLHCIFLYGKSADMRHSQYNVKATRNYQQDFVIPWPYKNYLAKKNIMKIFVRGAEYFKDIDFCIKDNMLEIFRVDKSLKEGEEIQFHFFHHINNENHIEIKETKANILKQDQTKFVINPPFYNYFQTGNKMFLTMGSVFIAENQYTIEDDKLTFNDDHVLSMTKDRDLYFTFVYHTVYERYNQAVHIDKDTHDLTQQSENPDGSLKITIPFPFEDYMELGNSFEMRVEGTRVIKEDEYDLIDNKYVLIINPSVSVYPYGQNIQFVFIYTCTGYEDVYEEDMEKDIDLKFVKVPLLENADKYLKDESNYVDYEHIIRSDVSWDEGYLHDYVKEAILNEQLSFSRTKYFCLTNLMSMGKMTYQLPYFMNMIFDDLKVEEKLTVKLPYISSSHEFKMNDVLVYMMALSHRFLGIEDDIPTIQKALYIKGFNFQADLATISTYIQQRINDSGLKTFYNISDKYKNFKMFKGQIPSYKELLEVYTNNTSIYDHVVYEMTHAENKLIYDCYKKIYESLMIVKESKRYFMMAGEQAKTLTEWIEFRDEELYESLVYIDGLDEEELRKNQISEYLENCVYQLSEYLNGDEFLPMFATFAGTNTNTILNYLLKVLNFFKSYKVQIHDIAIEYLFDDKLENKMLMIDEVLYSSAFDVLENGHSIFEILHTFVQFVLKNDNISKDIKEKLYISVKSYLEKIVKERLDLDHYISKIHAESSPDDWGSPKESQIHRGTIVVHSELDDILRDSFLIQTTLTPTTINKLLEQIEVIASHYIQHEKVEFMDIYNEIDNIRTIFYPEENFQDVHAETVTELVYFYVLEQNASLFTDHISYNVDQVHDEVLKIKENFDIFKQHFQEIIGKDYDLNKLFDITKNVYATFIKKDKHDNPDSTLSYATYDFELEWKMLEQVKFELFRVFSLFDSTKDVVVSRENQMYHEEEYDIPFTHVTDVVHNIELHIPDIYEIMQWIKIRFGFIEKIDLKDKANLSNSWYKLIQEYNAILMLLNDYVTTSFEIEDAITKIHLLFQIKSSLDVQTKIFSSTSDLIPKDDTQLVDYEAIDTTFGLKEITKIKELHAIYRKMFKDISLREDKEILNSVTYFCEFIKKTKVILNDSISAVYASIKRMDESRPLDGAFPTTTWEPKDRYILKEIYQLCTQIYKQLPTEDRDKNIKSLMKWLVSFISVTKNEFKESLYITSANLTHQDYDAILESLYPNTSIGLNEKHRLREIYQIFRESFNPIYTEDRDTAIKSFMKFLISFTTFSKTELRESLFINSASLTHQDYTTILESLYPTASLSAEDRSNIKELYQIYREMFKFTSIEDDEINTTSAISANSDFIISTKQSSKDSIGLDSINLTPHDEADQLDKVNSNSILNPKEDCKTKESHITKSSISKRLNLDDYDEKPEHTMFYNATIKHKDAYGIRETVTLTSN